MAPPAGGRVTAINLACGGGSTQCVLTLPVAAQVTLTATPDPGYTFMGWTEDCSGGTTTTLHVNGAKRCAALFEPSDPIAPRTVLRWNSQPGHYIGQGRSETYSTGNSKWTAPGVRGRRRGRVPGHERRPSRLLLLDIPTTSAARATCCSPAAGIPAPRAIRAPACRELVSPATDVSCGGGEFTVHEASFGPQNTLLRFAATFVVDCGAPTGPLLIGSVQYHSRPRAARDDADARSGIAEVRRGPQRRQHHLAAIAAGCATVDEQSQRRVGGQRQRAVDPGISLLRDWRGSGHRRA